MMRRKTLMVVLAWIAAVSGLMAALTAESLTERVYLSGQGADDTVAWDFKISKGMQAGEWTKIAVPSCWELQGFGQYQYGIKFYGKAFPDGVADEVGHYKYEFQVPESWRNKQVFIVFEASMTDTEVFINGQKAGPVHQGAFYRFSYNITERIKYGDTNLLEVKVAKESADASVNLAERRADYWNFGGIFRPVFLEAKPNVHIEHMAIDAKANGSFRFKGNLNRGGVMARLKVELKALKGKKSIVQEFSLDSGGDQLTGELEWKNPDLWTAETPHRYQAVFTLSDKEGKVLHQIEEMFGFRTVEVKESDGLYINGVKVIMKGVNRHSFRPETGRTLSKRMNIEDVELMKNMNMNAVRMSHYPPDPDFLDACDSLGLYVMDELGGWHGKYDTPVGRINLESMVRRDQNHPSVIWWSNGNEKGWNTALDPVFAEFDLQARPVLHPQGNFGGFETMHYRSYGESQEYMRLPEIFMPTEFLHGLYDGGHGAGLYDYWEMMRKHPRSAGGFLWVLADEGVVRTDKDGFIDNMGNYAADGIVGPHHEKEGSYYTIKELWSPVQIIGTNLNNIPEFTIENRYDFLNIRTVSFQWELVKFPDIRDKGAKLNVLRRGELKGPDIPAGKSGNLKMSAALDSNADALFLKAIDYRGQELWTWTYPLKAYTLDSPANKSKTPTYEEDEEAVRVKAGKHAYVFSKKDGQLKSVAVSGKTISFTNGPRFVAARRADRSLDQFYNHDDPDARKKERTYTSFEDAARFKGFNIQEEAGNLQVTASYKLGNMQEARWIIRQDGSLQLHYRYQFNAVVDLMGIAFDYPEEKMISKRWIGNGPYRVWQNRIHGPVYGLWENDYNDPIPGESFTYPEFKGYFSGVRAMNLSTREGEISLYNETDQVYLGVYEPRDGRDQLLYTLPKTGIAFLHVIPPVRNKVNTTDLIGPSSQPVWAQGAYTGSLIFQFR